MHEERVETCLFLSYRLSLRQLSRTDTQTDHAALRAGICLRLPTDCCSRQLSSTTRSATYVRSDNTSNTTPFEPCARAQAVVSHRSAALPVNQLQAANRPRCDAPVSITGYHCLLPRRSVRLCASAAHPPTVASDQATSVSNHSSTLTGPRRALAMPCHRESSARDSREREGSRLRCCSRSSKSCH